MSYKSQYLSIQCVFQIFIIMLSFQFQRIRCQFQIDSSQYIETFSSNVKSLQSQIEHNPDVVEVFDPKSLYIKSDFYKEDYPLSQYYRIRILMDPCRYNAYNCCMSVFGAPEYPALLSPNLEPERVVKPIVLASDVDVSKNVKFVTEEGNDIVPNALRVADDYSSWDPRCIAMNNPFSNCSGLNWAMQKSPLRPACVDNNYSLNALTPCYSPDGSQPGIPCVQVGYSQNAFIGTCGDSSDPNCGTYLEIHMPNGSPYQDESAVIAQTLITTMNVSGVYSTTLPLTWMGNTSRVLCAYTESFLRIGSEVYIKPNAPVCCCPSLYNTKTREGSFFCPKGPDDMLHNGPFAREAISVTDKVKLDINLAIFPYCPTTLSSNDSLWCITRDIASQRHYPKICLDVLNTTQNTLPKAKINSSSLLNDLYSNICPYFSSCGVTSTMYSSNTGLLNSCAANDTLFTFIGRVGIVTAIDTRGLITKVWVSFNNGRTSYPFNEDTIKLNYISKSMYQVWFVLRTKSNDFINKKKGFNVTSPTCTFDITNNRYFPYAELDNNGNPIDSAKF